MKPKYSVVNKYRGALDHLDDTAENQDNIKILFIKFINTEKEIVVC